ncbi:MAG TPA: FGLLP motif-containing membrane protein [Acidimicrobiales bacterium]|nr:FGLLP motif-containing membrane protein [Acidimicrobiales bacterium]
MASRACQLGFLLLLGLAMVVVAWPSHAAQASPVSPLGTWDSTALCCGGSFPHVTTVSTFDPGTGTFTGTDSNGALTGKMQGATFTMDVGFGTGYSFVLNGSIEANKWTGNWKDSAGRAGTWSGTRVAAGGKLIATSSPPGTVSSIASSLPAPSKAFSPLKSDIVDGAVTIGLALFLTFPSNLFNSTFQENYADIVAWLRKWADLLFPVRLRRALVKVYSKALSTTLHLLGLSGRSQHKKLEREKASFVAVLLAGALLGALLDPAFGLNTRTLLSFIAIVIAMVAGVFVSAFIAVGYHRARGHGKVPYKLESLPAGLLIAALCVVISRGAGFAPGYLYGVIFGVAFARELSKQEEGHVIALGAVVRVVLAIMAWVAWAALTHDATRPGNFFGKVLLDDFLASLFVSSLVGTVISLFPLRFLPGHKLQQWHKGVWAATFGITLFVLVQVLLRPHSTSSGPSHAPLITTIVLFVLFALGSVLFRDHFARKRRRAEAAPEPEPAST